MIEPSRPAVWAGVEPSHLTIGGRRRDQLVATGHADRLEDIDRIAELGVSAVRYPVLWGWRGEPTDWEWAKARLGRLESHGIEPIVGLVHHGWGPDDIDPLDPRYPDALAAYAVEVARRFPQIRTFLPVNEALTTARFSGLYGWWDPCARDETTFARLIVAECQAIRAAARRLRDLDASIRILVNDDAGETYGTNAVADVVSSTTRGVGCPLTSSRARSTLTIRCGSTWPSRATSSSPSRTSPTTPNTRICSGSTTTSRATGSSTTGPTCIPRTSNEAGRIARFVDVEVARVPGFEVDGFWRSLRQTWERYGIPMALTEVHIGGDPEDEVAWWAEAWQQAGWAVDEGIPVEGVTSWAAFGGVDWDSLLCREAGWYRAGMLRRPVRAAGADGPLERR